MDAAVKVGTSELITFGRERLSPGSYNLDLSGIASFSLKYNGEPSTFADIYEKLRNEKVIEFPERFGGIWEQTYVTDSGNVTISGGKGQSYVSGQSSVMQILRELVKLSSEGIEPGFAKWFYYGSDWSRDADELFFFFVVYDEKIVRESLSFMHCDPRVLIKYEEDDEPIWHSDPYYQAAGETYWYRKFYTETLTGQLMVLRPDEPILYHYERLAHDFARDIQFVTLIKAYRLLWIAVSLLIGIAFPILKPYAGVAAIYCFVDLLWRIWATRKVGTPL